MGESYFITSGVSVPQSSPLRIIPASLDPAASRLWPPRRVSGNMINMEDW